jgi:hypothetical protein
VHAEVRCAAEQRSELEHLCRYITRSAVGSSPITACEIEWTCVMRFGLRFLLPSP